MNDEQECRQERLSLSETIASVSIAILGLFTLLRGINWIVYHDNPSDIALYASLIEAAPLYIWGGVFVVGALLSMSASIFLPRRHIKKRFYVALLLGGVITSVNYFIVAIAGFNNATTWLIPSQMITLSAFAGILAFFGGTQLWQIRSTKNM